MQTKTVPILFLAFVIGALPALAAEETADPMAQPTKNGIRLTPTLARALAAQWLSEHVDPEIAITPQQQTQLSDSVARRLMDLARNHKEHTQQLLEYSLENFMTRPKQFDAETGKKLAERSAPMIPAMHEFLDGIGQDARSVLKPEDMTRFDERLRREHANINNFETKMQRWSQGQIGEGEQPFSDLESSEPLPGSKKPSSPAVQRAIRRATWSLSSLGPAQWEAFIAGVKRLFKFDEKQSTDADQILAKYRAEADQIMTPEWKKSLQQNRLKYNLRGTLPQNTAPWLYHLDREFNETIAPLSDLGQKLRSEVLNLVTNEQRVAAAQELEQLTNAHGLKLEDADKTMLGLNAHQ